MRTVYPHKLNKGFSSNSMITWIDKYLKKARGHNSQNLTATKIKKIVQMQITTILILITDNALSSKLKYY